MVIMKLLNVELNLLKVVKGELKDHSATVHGCIIQAKPNSVGDLVPQIHRSANKSIHICNLVSVDPSGIERLDWLDSEIANISEFFHRTYLFKPIAAHACIDSP